MLIIRNWHYASGNQTIGELLIITQKQLQTGIRLNQQLECRDCFGAYKHLSRDEFRSSELQWVTVQFLQDFQNGLAQLFAHAVGRFLVLVVGRENESGRVCADVGRVDLQVLCKVGVAAGYFLERYRDVDGLWQSLLIIINNY